jgi:hypothetical protein
MHIMDADDAMETHQYTFTGLSDVYNDFMLDVAGAAEMPVTKLFGRAPAGMNATGESDMQNYYDSIEQKQESLLRPVLEKLMPVLWMSEFGAVPDDMEIKFNPCRRPSEEEKKNLGKNVADSVVAVFNTGLISQRTALKELRQSADYTDMWTNITDEDIDKASDELQSPGEDMAGLPGQAGLPGLGGLFSGLPAGRQGEEAPGFKLPPTSAQARDKGNANSGNHGHQGRPGEVGGSGAGGGASSPEEKQKKIDSVKIDFDRDNTLPELNPEDLEELGKASKPVLLKKGVIERNLREHAEVSRENYDRIVGEALYSSDLKFKGKSERHNQDYMNFVKVIPHNNSLVLLELAEHKDTFEVVHLFTLGDRSLKRMQKKEN